MRTLLLISVGALLAGANEKRGDPIFAFGLPHQALGQAELLLKPSGDLLITNIGDSGEDGARIDDITVNGVHMEMNPATFPVGAQVTTDTIGMTADGSIQSAGTLRQERTDAGVTVTPDFSSVGAPTFTVRVFNDGELVAVEEGISGIAATVPAFASGICTHRDKQTGQLDFTCHFPLGPVLVILPSGQQVNGDLLRFTADPATPIVAFEAVELTAKDTSDLLIGGEWIILFDDHIPHLALGDARFQPTDGQLILSGLDDASADGVQFDFIDFIVATQPEAGFRALLEGAALDAPGSEVALSARGTVNGVEDVPLGTASLENVEGVVQVFADYEPLGTDVVKVEMYQDGDFVGSITVPGGMVGTAESDDEEEEVIIIECEKKAPGKPSDPPCFVFGFDHPVVFEPGTLVGDELRLLAADAPFPIDSLQSFDLTSSVGEITIVDANILGSCEGDANGDGAVDPLDSGYVLARFGCPVGTGDPGCDAADQNGDGAVDPLDSGFVLARFGPCQ